MRRVLDWSAGGPVMPGHALACTAHHAADIVPAVGTLRSGWHYHGCNPVQLLTPVFSILVCLDLALIPSPVLGPVHLDAPPYRCLTGATTMVQLSCSL